MKIKILNKSEKNKIIEKLEKYGINKIPYLLIQTGREKIRAFSGNLSKEEIIILNRLINIESIGLYFAKFHGTDLRLSIDACHILKSQINKKIIKLTDKQAQEYLEGKTVEIKQKLKNDFYILKHNLDILGMAKITENIIKNYLPKERRKP